MKKLLEAITGDDNVTIEPAYLWWALAILVGIGLEIYSVVTGKPFDLQSYGVGVGALLVGGGFGKKVGG
ncbi:hypothetical protein [Paludibacterium denitrificans]|uniref:Uncharacterized protein n=1 Tax=Paludibacterium denitrificans TaxID=2675226 RepID=A0A844GBZ0_9NEIS|nr:hypothetical protein [Paludibacterium denitrificans]MTD34046.1 hypothetical protein [Paludibacterium denitrificans]